MLESVPQLSTANKSQLTIAPQMAPALIPHTAADGEPRRRMVSIVRTLGTV